MNAAAALSTPPWSRHYPPWACSRCRRASESPCLPSPSTTHGEVTTSAMETARGRGPPKRGYHGGILSLLQPDPIQAIETQRVSGFGNWFFFLCTFRDLFMLDLHLCYITHVTHQWKRSEEISSLQNAVHWNFHPLVFDNECYHELWKDKTHHLIIVDVKIGSMNSALERHTQVYIISWKWKFLEAPRLYT